MSSVFYPQAVCVLRVRWEDFDEKTNRALSKIQDLPVLARRVRVNINDYTQADTFEIEVDYKDFPFDPRTIRSMGVSIFMEDVKQLYDATGKLKQLAPSDDNIIFLGFADSEKIDFNEEDRVVRIEGRDFTALLLDAPFDGLALDLGLPLDTLISVLFNQLPSVSEGKLKVVNRTGVSPLPTLGRFAPDFNTYSNERSGKVNEKYWDVIQDIAGRAGVIVFIELDSLVITKPRSLYADSQLYQFIYGKNIRNLSFERKLGRNKGLNIIVRSVVVETKQTLEVKIPEEADAAWAKSVGVERSPQMVSKLDAEGNEKTEPAPYISFVVPNIKNTNQLREIAQGIWEEIGRQQIEGNFATHEMSFLQRKPDGSGILELDVTKIRNGTPVQIEIDQGDLEGFKRQETRQQRMRYLINRGYRPEVADALAQTTGKFQTRFYTKSVEFSQDADSGFECRIEFINFIELGNRGIG